MPHATATFNRKIIAEADSWEFVEGNIYVSIYLQRILFRLDIVRVQLPTDG